MNRATYMLARARKVDEFTLAANVDLVWRGATTGDRRLTAPTLRIDPGGAARNVDLPPANASQGVTLRIVNTADAAEALTVRNASGATTVVTIDQGEAATVYCDGAAWTGNVDDAT